MYIRLHYTHTRSLTSGNGASRREVIEIDDVLRRAYHSRKPSLQVEAEKSKPSMQVQGCSLRSRKYSVASANPLITDRRDASVFVLEFRNYAHVHQISSSNPPPQAK
jgi:hypothetical protein